MSNYIDIESCEFLLVPGKTRWEMTRAEKESQENRLNVVRLLNIPSWSVRLCHRIKWLLAIHNEPKYTS